MSKYSYNQAQKSALRSAITSHAQWPSFSSRHKLSSSALTVSLMEHIAEQLTPPIDCSLYGTPKRGHWNGGEPKPRNITPETMHAVKARFDAILPQLTFKQTTAFHTIWATVTKQEYWATQGQYNALNHIVLEGEFGNFAGSAAPVAAQPVEPAPAQAPAIVEPMPPSTPSNDAALVATILELLKGRGNAPAQIDESRIVELIKQHAGQPAQMLIDLRSNAGFNAAAAPELAHYKLPLLASALAAGVPVMLVGTVGSGKTTVGKQVAKMLGRGFEFTGAISNEFALKGFVDAQGKIVSTAFRRAFTEGGIFLFDEMDGSLPGAVLPFNAAVANRVADFPDGKLEAHPDFMPIAACNTYGRGADRMYVGRLQQDSAVTDRYITIDWDLDVAIEAGMLGLPRPRNAQAPYKLNPILDAAEATSKAAQWLARVQAVRAAIEKHKLRHIVSPRASLYGAKLLAAGWAWYEVEESCIYKGLDADSRAKLAA